MRSYTINRAGNDHDVDCTIKCGWKTITIADLQAGIDNEKAGSNRTTRIKLMERYIKKKRKELIKDGKA